jgi:hypothetical protein
MTVLQKIVLIVVSSFTLINARYLLGNGSDVSSVHSTPTSSLRAIFRTLQDEPPIDDSSIPPVPVPTPTPVVIWPTTPSPTPPVFECPPCICPDLQQQPETLNISVYNDGYKEFAQDLSTITHVTVGTFVLILLIIFVTGVMVGKIMLCDRR